MFHWSVSLFMKVWRMFLPYDKELVIFSGLSRKYNDSPRAIYEYMLANPDKYSKYKCVWALETPHSTDIPGNPIKVKADSLQYFKYTLMAGYWITSVNIERSLNYKRKKCKYLNTWHGTPIKHVGNDAVGRKDYDFGNIDLFCCASAYEKEIFMRAFKVRENAMIATGLPRNDELYRVTNEEIISIKLRLGIPLDKKIILYAPTWRDSNDKGRTYVIKPPIDIETWTERLKDDYVVLFRTHAYTTKVLGITFNQHVLNYSDYPAINDLFKISDILISDYSASIIDFSILERPIITFAYDYESYKSERGLYLDYVNDMPSGILRTEEEVLDYILNMDYKDECNKTKVMIKERMLEVGGDATKACTELLFNK